MPLTLVLGPANSAKAGEVLGAYAAATSRGGLLIVPTARDAEYYSRELAEQGCVLRRVLTFAGLAEEIARRVGYSARRLSELQRERVVRKVTRDCRLDVLEEVARTNGFSAAAGELFSELERALVRPPRFARALSAWSGEDPARAAYAHDLGALYLAYARELERLGRVDAELFTWQALDALRSTPARWGSEPVFFYGFDDLHELERDAIETLSRVVGVEVVASLTYEAGRAATASGAGLVAELRPLAQRVLELPAVADYYEPEARAALHHLERSLFENSGSSRAVEPGGSVRLLESAGELAEAELVAAEIRGLLDHGIAGHDIAVVYRTLSSGVPVIASVCERYGIPTEVDRRVGFVQTALGRGLVALARCGLLDADASRPADLISYLRTPGVLRRPELADGLELEVRRAGLRTVAESRERFPLGLDEIDTLAAASSPLRELARQGRRLLAAAFPHRAHVLDRDEQMDARALARLLRAAAELDELSDAPLGEDLLELLEGLEVTAAAGREPGAVLVSDPLAIRARRFRAVFVCGLQEGIFPAAGGPEPFLSDERRRELAASSGLRLRPREDMLDRERYLFYACVSRATEHVILSYRSCDEEGNVALPSPFLDDVADVLGHGWRERRRRRMLADVVWPVDEAPTAREQQRSLAASAGGVGEPAAPPRRLGADALEKVRHTEVVSAGALESYAECHMKWLVERELRPQALEPDAEPLTRGSAAHDVLEKVLARLGGPVTPESLPEAIRLLDETLEAVSPQLAAGRSAALRAAATQSLAADLRRYLEYETAFGSGWVPRGLEMRFGFEEEEEGEGESLPALVLGDGAERIAVRGAIDRVDVDPRSEQAVVRDYKTGAVRQEWQGNRWRSGQRLQVALYMIAVRELLGLDAVAGLYQPLGGKDLRPRGIYESDAAVGTRLLPADAREPAALHEELEDASARAVALAAALRAGDLEPCPETCSRDGCQYPGICRA
jgi:ATP-dependent helicase/DNAse subunit B